MVRPRPEGEWTGLPKLSEVSRTCTGKGEPGGMCSGGACSIRAAWMDPLADDSDMPKLSEAKEEREEIHNTNR
eukprot:473914-Hanusia_phi.AAC.1